MRTTVVVVALLFSAGLGQAAGERLTLAQPRDSGLSVASVSTSIDVVAKFNGDARASGTFMGFWPEGATNLNYKEPDYLFIPDKPSSARLPHFVLRDPPHFKSYRVRSVTVTNGLQALHDAAGAEKVKRLLERRVNHVRVTGTFVLEDFTVGVECDAPWASAKLVKAEVPDQVAVQHNSAPGGC